jgi:hypothetical protein
MECPTRYRFADLLDTNPDALRRLIMNTRRYGKFQSAWDFIDKFIKFFKGPYGSSKVLDKVFQEEIRITVTFANNCFF